MIGVLNQSIKLCKDKDIVQYIVKMQELFMDASWQEGNFKRNGKNNLLKIDIMFNLSKNLHQNKYKIVRDMTFLSLKLL